MRIGFNAVSLLLGVALLALGGSCDDSGGGADWAGHWMRTRTLEPTSQLQVVDRWHLVIGNDGTFTEYHERSDNLGQYPFEPREARKGTWRKDGENLLLEGQWLQFGTQGIESLADLEGNLYAYRRSAMVALSPSGDMLLVGPDVTHFANWPYSESYSLMRFDAGANRLWRRSSVELRDASGEVLQGIDEELTFNVTGTGECSGQIALKNTDGSGTVETEGSLTSCGYVVSEVEIEDVGGEGTLTLQAVVFNYEAEGLTGLKTEYFIAVGEHYLGYRSGEQAVALRNSAFVRVGD